jgi:subtilase family serine protease
MGRSHIAAPDLIVVNSIPTSPMSILFDADPMATASVTIKNNGEISTEKSFAVKVMFDGEPLPGSPFIVPALGSKKSYTITGISLPNAGVGIHYISAIADINNDISEYNENNNRYIFGKRYYSNQPDLVSQFQKVSSSVGMIKETIQIGNIGGKVA